MGHAVERQAAAPTGREFFVEATSSRFAVRDVLADLTAALRQWGASDDCVSTTELVAAEALNNIVEHAFGFEEGRPFSMKAALDDSALTLAITDSGKPMPGLVLPATATGEGASPCVDVPMDDLPEGGWGWFLIHDLTKDLSYERRDELNFLTIVLEP